MDKKKTSKKKFNNIKKSIRNFLIDEEGFITKDNMLKIGIGTVSALGLIGSMNTVSAAHTNHPSHNNTNTLGQQSVANTFCYRLYSVHTNHPSHTVHSSY